MSNAWRFTTHTPLMPCVCVVHVPLATIPWWLALTWSVTQQECLHRKGRRNDTSEWDENRAFMWRECYDCVSVCIDGPSFAFIPQDQTELWLALIPALPKTYGSVFADLGQRWIKHTYTNGHTHTQKWKQWSIPTKLSSLESSSLWSTFSINRFCPTTLPTGHWQTC